ncbi:MAG: hypothetical protein KF782_16405 [Labilithrix sp.]|nr:hypothetical protein [Labilithrix sp.]
MKPGWLAKASTFALALATALSACAVDTAPDGARRTPPGTGPEIVFDTLRRPLPEIPQPNDVATFADPTSRTGRRINVSLVAPTSFETVARQGFDSLEGWGTFAPISVAFARSAATPETDAALDLEDVAARTRTYDPTDDPFYVIDLTTGVPVPLDLGKGNFPLALVDRDKYWANDPRVNEDSLLFETYEEGAGLPQSAYRPELDTDFDGVLDHPNVLVPFRGDQAGRSARIEEVIDWYERQTDTLLLRPVVPLEEKREYAVVLTDRLRGPDGAPVRSPFEHVHHAQQRRGAERVREILGDPSKRAWFGDVAGTGLEHVAFVWTFTTQPVYEDMRILRDGLHGVGPFARLATEFPPDARAFRAVGTALEEIDEPPGAIDRTPACAPRKKTPFVVKVADSKDAMRQLLERALGLSGGELDRLIDSLDSVDHLVIGSFESPYFLGDPKNEDPDGKFELDFRSGAGRVGRDTVQFWLSVPKATEAKEAPDGTFTQAHEAPFPVTVWAHGTTLHADEIIVRAGYFAKQGLAMMGINMPGHGLYLDPGLEAVANVVFRGECLSPWVRALGSGRHTDLNGDGEPDSGGLLWSAHVFHSRDNIRQAVVDEMQATRVLRAWDGVRRSTQDYDGDGVPDLAGDFDGDGVPDVGGPNVAITTSGNSFGGVLAMVHGALDPNVVAAAPISGGGGLMDVATRSSLVPDSVLQQVLSPLVVGVPASALPEKDDREQTRCAGDQRSVRLVVNDLTVSRELEIACLTPAELDEGKTVVLTNVRNQERHCARTGPDGRFRIPIPANVGDRLDVQVYDAPDAVRSYKGCDALEGAPLGRRIRTFEQASIGIAQVGDATKTCEAAYAGTDLDPAAGCQQFRDRFYPVGSPLVAPQEGLGLYRQSPEARRLLNLTQTAVDPSDPINFAPYYGLRAAPGPDGRPMPPRAILELNTAGDPMVPVSTGYAFARAAGAVPFLPPSFADTHPEWAEYATPPALWDQLGGKTPNDVLVESHVLEGVARLERTRAGAACAPNYVASDSCTSPPSSAECARAVFDVDWLSEGENPWAAPRPAIPLRLARSIDVRANDALSLARTWEPRTTGAPFASDATAWTGTQPLSGVVNTWIQPGGQHVFVTGDPCKKYDDVVYYSNLLVRFLATQGKDLYYFSHPSSHRCLERALCPFFR